MPLPLLNHFVCQPLMIKLAPHLIVRWAYFKTLKTTP
jgi:hypothetical protein